ncbi:MAG TPA: glycosyltransferase [Nitrospira sp.]|nr:glycosyltransferase [Nitrospira sp.]
MAVPERAAARKATRLPVSGNAWDSISIPEIGAWEPTATVSVVIPYYQAPDQLEITLAALQNQSYPSHLLEVVVADDGSDPPLELPPRSGGPPVRVIHQERDGFGLARARNLGAESADGEILVFLDCDMVPERRHIEAHARWHHEIEYALVFGLRRHVDFDDIEPSMVAEAVRSDRLADLFAGRPVQAVQWVAQHLERSDWLKADMADPWRVTSGGNLSIRRDFFWEVGGYDQSFRQWGGEDNEFGFRAYNQGAVVVPEPGARAWHQGEGHEPTDQESFSLEEQRPKLANLIPDPSMRRSRIGRTYTVPMMTIEVLATEGTKEQTLSAVESILAGRFGDLVVFVELSGQDPHLEWMRRQFAGDGRVRVGTDLDPMREIPGAPLRMELPNSILVSVGTLESVVDLMWRENLGAVHITNPDWDNALKLIEVYRTRAWERASRFEEDPALRNAMIGKLFTERWISGISCGCFATDSYGTPRAETSWLSELEARDAHIRVLQSRRSLRIADAVGSVLSARSWRQLAEATQSVWRALFRNPSQA